MEGNFGPIEQVLWSVSVFSGVIMCKVVYDLTRKISTVHFKGYDKLSRLQRIEWNNRGFSTFHAIVVAAVSLYLLVVSDLFKSGTEEELVINRKSLLSDTIFGISLGYFLSDLAMILWHFPSLGGKEYVLHHGLSMFSIFLSLVSGKAHMYILMILLTETTTPFVNLRWYLDHAGQKVLIYTYTMAARILLFIYFFMHIYLHFHQVKTIFPLGLYTLLTVSPILTLMNLFWFWKILKGMLKTLSKKRHVH